MELVRTYLITILFAHIRIKEAVFTIFVLISVINFFEDWLSSSPISSIIINGQVFPVMRRSALIDPSFIWVMALMAIVFFMNNVGMLISSPVLLHSYLSHNTRLAGLISMDQGSIA